MTIGLGHYLSVGAILFTLGISESSSTAERHRHPDVD